MAVQSEGEPVFTEGARSDLVAARTAHLRDGILLTALGVFVAFLLPYLLNVSPGPRSVGIEGAGFVLGIAGGTGLGMAAYGWMLTKAKWGSKLFPIPK
jgi:hypothetical protein